MDAFDGRTLSHYQVLERLGQGGMGVVYKARDTRLNRLVAVKVLPPDRTADPVRRARLIHEAQTASALNHPNIVTIFEIERDADCDFIVMELIPGRTLDRIIGQGLNLSAALRYGIQIADALAAAHASGIVHRDLKPSNIIVMGNGTAKVLDFGLAKLMESGIGDEDGTRTLLHPETPLTEHGEVLGTVTYMSPEQAEGKHVDSRTDIFSFGSLLYEMLTGHPPFQRDTKTSTVTAILRDDAKSLIDAGVAAPREIEKIIIRCLRKDPARRFQHMGDVKIALEELKEDSESGRLDDAVPSVPVRRSRTVWLTGMAVIFALAAILLAWQILSSPAPRQQLTLRPLTQDPGLSYSPSLSPDGRLVTYASNRAGEGNMDIWVQQVSQGAQPIRLTRHKADDVNPSFSPDGGHIAFISSRDGGGIYVVPALGGEEQLLMRGDYGRSRFSSDGKWIAASTRGSFGGNQILLVPAGGGAARRFAPDYYTSGPFAWSPDAKWIIFEGWPRKGGEQDWWVLSIDGGNAVATGAVKVVKPAVGRDFTFISEWLDDYVLYTTGNLHRVAISRRTFQVSGTPERLTTSSAFEWSPRAVTQGKAGNWRIVFSATQSRTNLWRLPIDANKGKALSEPEVMFRDGVERMSPVLSADGSHLLYVFHEVDSFGARLRNLKNETETTLVRFPEIFRAKLSPDGSTVAYNPTDNINEYVVHLVSSRGGDSRKLCDSCGLIYSWTPDGKAILFRKGSPMRFYVVDATSGQYEPLLGHAEYHVLAVDYSPDRRWLAMQYGRGEGAPRALFIIPVRNNKPAPENEWIPVMDRPGIHQRPWWSPDGNRLYFVSNAGGQVDIWSQQLDPTTKRIVGEPQVLYHPPADRLDIIGDPTFGPGQSRDSLVFPMAETTGNVWIAE